MAACELTMKISTEPHVGIISQSKLPPSDAVLSTCIQLDKVIAQAYNVYTWVTNY